MRTFLVIWTIEIDAETHHEAAQKALEIQRDPNNIATQFEVRDMAEGGETQTLELYP